MGFWGFKKIIFAVAALVVLGSAIFARSKIFRLPDFGSSGAVRTAPAVLSASSSSAPVPPVPAPEKTAPVEKGLIPQNSHPAALSARTAPPPYAGRDTEEVRPVFEEVKLFSDGQRRQIYREIGNDGAAVKKDPFFFNGWIHLGILKKTIGDFEGARDAWEYVGAIEPLNSLSFADLGELYWRYLHDYPSAEKNFKISIERKPSDTATYVSLADLYHYSYAEKSALAYRALQDGMEKNPGSSDLIRHTAFLYEADGKLPDAMLWWEKALALNPDDSRQIKDHIDQLRAKIK